MNRRRSSRIAILIALPALLVPIAASSATAAPKLPAVPSLAKVVKIYPGLRGGEVDVRREAPVKAPGEDCGEGRRIRGAVGRVADYTPEFDYDKPGYGMTAASPSISLITERFPSVRVARTYFEASVDQLEQCMLADDEDVDLKPAKPIRFRLGDQHVGYRVRGDISGLHVAMNVVGARSGKAVVLVVTMSMTKKAPSAPRTVDVARLALRTAR